MEKVRHVHSRNLERQSSRRRVIGRLESFLKSKLSRLRRESAYFSPSTSVSRIPILDREEVSIGSFIGNGSFSEVREVSGLSRRAQHAMGLSTDDNDNRVVIKHLRSGISIGQKEFHKASRNLLTEATLLGRLNHPHILKLRACASTGTLSYGSRSHDSFCLILDRFDFTMREQIDQWKCEQQEATKELNLSVDRLCYALEIAEVLEYLHDRRLIYRDLKPANIGLKNNSIQLLDFGLCRELPQPSLAFGSEERYLMSYAGTPRYVAPEVHTRQGYNVQADVYSWAIVCFEMMSLEEPYSGMNRRELYTEVCCEGLRPDIDDLPWNEDLASLLDECWAQNLQERLSMREVCEALEEIIAFTDPELAEASIQIDGDFDFKEESESTMSTLSLDSWMSDDDSLDQWL